MEQAKSFQPGFFDPATNEYILEDPRTPMPWMHYLFNREYTALVSVTGGGYSFHKTARDRRLLRMRPNNVPCDRPGRYIYIRNDQDGDFFSAGWAPVMKPLEQQSYRCRLGAGYLAIESEYRQLATQLCYFVPADDNLEVWQLSLRNQGQTPLALSLFSYAEFALFDAANDRDNYQYTYNIANCFCTGNTIIHNTMHAIHRVIAFFTSSLDIAGYECDREKFIGMYHTEANPRGVLNGSLENSRVSGKNPCGAHQLKVNLAPGAAREIIFLLGVAETQEDIPGIAKRYFEPGFCRVSREKVRQTWQEVFDRFVIETPVAEVNSFNNFWNPYQMRTTFYLSRGPSIYEGGIGRGMGFRDSNQDTLGPAYQLDTELKDLMAELMHFQYPSGYAAHGFFRLLQEGYGDQYSDDHLWLLPAVTNYLKESGDLAFLEKELPYYQTTEKGSVFNHLQRALDFTRENRGDHGMPLAFHADWNDCLNLRGPLGKGESVWVGFLYHKALLDFIDLCKLTGKMSLAGEYGGYAEQIRDRINAAAWDGQWYVRAYDDNGAVIGSQQNQYGRLFLNSQTWAVLSGVATQERGRLAMDQVREKCSSDYGLSLLWPAYREYSPLLGAISAYPPGLKENAGIFCHANTWAIIAECLLGRGEYAMEYYNKVLPPRYNAISGLRRSEPYIYSQVIAGPEHPDFGLARNSWLTGTASWMFTAFTQYILGIKPQYRGLRIDPCIPAAWDGFKVTRQFRGIRYKIEVSNPEHVNRGVKEIQVDGKRITDTIVPPVTGNNGQVVTIKVILGKEGAEK